MHSKSRTQSTPPKNVIGLDVGSVSVSFVVLDAERQLLDTGYAVHHGRVDEAIGELLGTISFDRVGWVAVTASAAESVTHTASYDSHVAHVAAAKHLHGQVGTLLLLGGEKFSVIQFDARGEYRETRTNSGCAAGTGSFLDEQAKNLGLSDSAELSAMALTAEGEVPKVASRCAVFAKTDIIHAQQEGYSRQAICSGLCRGLATIIADTLFAGERALQPVVVAGGLARNRAVIAHLESLVQGRLEVDELAPAYGALGAALLLLDELEAQAPLRAKGSLLKAHLPLTLFGVQDLRAAEREARSYEYKPLTLSLSSYPDFTSELRYEFAPRVVRGTGIVELDIYEATEAGQSFAVRMGIDIGSTSTKAVLLTEAGQVLAGAYTRTHGRPVAAVQAIFESLEDWTTRAGVSLRILGVGTTGSGRKLIGNIVGADLVIDEITAHARAAYELDPQTDTIIEIGGQDAKFTTMRAGMVTSAVMNTVCAAGTGSFIEEQARRLGCPLSEYAQLVEGAPAPIASDRCTVFMQRDVNHLLSSGYAVSEILATVLHAVRENYLQKVAREGAIGKRICFQGATAKNKALVAAFEQKLERPIQVSKYCHLTGALGTAHLCAERGITESTFRGLRLFHTEIPLQKETCELCNNHCKVVKAEVMGEVSSYGFLCGRDEGSDRYVSNNRSGFDLLKARNRVLRVGKQPVRQPRTIGIPAALYLVEDMPLWKKFFQSLGFSVVTSEACPDPVGVGKKLARAEFCAPVAAFHGHVAWLADKADFLFVPFYLEAEVPNAETRRQYCYYSQYAPTLIQTLAIKGLEDRLIMPLFTDGVDAFQSKARLFSALRRALPGTMSFAQFASAHRDAVQFAQSRRADLREVMAREVAHADDVSVVLLGRPYTCLPPRMNKRIPETLASLGVKTFFQDMLAYEPNEVDGIRDLLELVHWNYASKILEAAHVIAHRKGVYPVLVTSFKCAPDSCTLEFFRRILDAAGKPNLILELDEHASSVGYETRIEAAVGAFRNHYRSPRSVPVRRSLAMNPAIVDNVEGKTLVIPSWDPLSGELLVANLQHEGVDAVLMRQDALGIQKSLRMNTGQCIPLSAAAQGFIDTVEALNLDPANAVLWNIDSRIACNIGGFPGVIKSLLEEHGGGFEHAQVYRGEISFLDFSVRAGLNAYFAYMFGGLLRRLVCRIRPYEVREGETDRVLGKSLRVLRNAFLTGQGKIEVVERVVDWFAAIPTYEASKPKVAIFGDLYTRDNDVMNQDLIRFIEKNGGEVVTTPYHVYARLIADTYFSRWLREGQVKIALMSRAVLAALSRIEKKYQEQFNRILGPVRPSALRAPTEVFERFGMTERHSGESLENLLEIMHVLDTQPDTSLFVQAVPAFCCPSLVTEALSRTIERATGVPIVTVIYDGTPSSKNDVIIPYLKFPRKNRVPRRRLARI